jgi:hypothetical protein
MTKAEKRAERQQLGRDAHRELDSLCRLARKLSAAETLCKNDLERANIDVPRQALLERTRQFQKF